MACERLLGDKNQPCRSGESGDEVSRVDRENREMSRRVLVGFGHISLNLDVHASVSPSPDSPDLHG